MYRCLETSESLGKRAFFVFTCTPFFFTRIDYFFIDHKLLPNVTSSEYLPIVIADHRHLALDVVLSGQTQPLILSYGNHLRPILEWELNLILLI